jgi:hypothetical protein
MSSSDTGPSDTTRPSGRNPLVIALVVIAALVVALAALSAFAGVFAGTTSSSNEYEGVTTIELDMRASGSVEIAASEGDRVMVERSVRSLLGSPHADEDQRGDIVRWADEVLEHLEEEGG